MKRHTLCLIAAAAFAAAGSAHAINAADAMRIIEGNGYVAPTGLELTNGVWRAKATSQDGVQRSVLVNDANGQFTAIDPTALRNGWGLPGAAQVVQALNAAGWAVVEDVEFDSGLWEADVRRAAGQPEYEVLVHPVTLAILGNPETAGAAGAATSVLTAQQITQAVTAAGYRNITEVEYDDDGYWEVDAVNASGQAVELDVNPTTGAILREQVRRGGAGAAPATPATPTQPVATPTTPTTPATPAQPTTGTIRLTSSQAVAAHLASAGYTRVRDVEYKPRKGAWEADAYNARGQKVELLISASTGAIISEKLD